MLTKKQVEKLKKHNLQIVRTFNGLTEYAQVDLDDLTQSSPDDANYDVFDSSGYSDSFYSIESQSGERYVIYIKADDLDETISDFLGTLED